jgi:hypothetical protein
MRRSGTFVSCSRTSSLGVLSQGVPGRRHQAAFGVAAFSAQLNWDAEHEPVLKTGSRWAAVSSRLAVSAHICLSQVLTFEIA